MNNAPRPPRIGPAFPCAACSETKRLVYRFVRVHKTDVIGVHASLSIDLSYCFACRAQLTADGRRVGESDPDYVPFSERVL